MKQKLKICSACRGPITDDRRDPLCLPCRRAREDEKRQAREVLICPDCSRTMGVVTDTGEPVCQWCIDDRNVEAANLKRKEGAAMVKLKAIRPPAKKATAKKAPAKKAKKAVTKIMSTLDALSTPAVMPDAALEVTQTAPVNDQPAEVRRCRICDYPIQTRYTKAYAEGAHILCVKEGATPNRKAAMEKKAAMQENS